MGTQKVRKRTTVFKALANESRCRIVEILAEEGEKCVRELVDRLGLDQSTVSKHLGVLRNADIVSFRKEGLNVWYSLHATCTYQFMKCIDHMCESGAGTVLGPGDCGLAPADDAGARGQ
jgi:ArsR family transcriptional regulator